jgi:TatA/E family protein of Tat protein translocase
MLFLNIYPVMLPLFGISGGEILILLLLVLLLFGPSKIPEIARMLGKGMGEIRKMQGEINAEINRYSSDVDRDTKILQEDIDNLRRELDRRKSATEDKATAGGDLSGEPAPDAEPDDTDLSGDKV